MWGHTESSLTSPFGSLRTCKPVVWQGLKAEARDQLLRTPGVKLFRPAVRERGACPRSVCGLFGEKKTNRARVSIRLSFVRDVCTVEIASQRLHGEHRRQRLGSPPRRLRLRIKSPVTHVIEADAWPGSGRKLCLD